MKKQWWRYSEEHLLDFRICDLDLSLEKSFVYPLIQQVLKELENKGIMFKPHFWISNEWHTPDGIPGVGVPFFLMHPKLTKLERKRNVYVEGDTPEKCLKVLRHEVGHAIDNAYDIRRRKKRIKLFGKFTEKYYTTFYYYCPTSKDYVDNVGDGYAQSHPAEDWAETFAVWLDPNSDWRKKYADWPIALEKLEYIEDIVVNMNNINLINRSRKRNLPWYRIKKTLRNYYEKFKVVDAIPDCVKAKKRGVSK